MRSFRLIDHPCCIIRNFSCIMPSGVTRKSSIPANSARSGFDLEFKLRTVETDIELHGKVHRVQWFSSLYVAIASARIAAALNEL